MVALSQEAQRLLATSVSDSTWKAYRTGLRAFDNFRMSYSLPHLWPVPVSHLISFVSFLSIKGLALNSVRLYTTSISVLHKLSDMDDNSSHFIVTKLLDGFRRSRPGQGRTREPITFPLLEKIISKLPLICNSIYETCLFKAAFTLAFFGFLRIGEFALTTKSAQHKLLQLADVKITSTLPPVAKVRVRFSKTDQLGRGTTLQISANVDGQLCPVQSLIDFMSQRGEHAGQFFCHFDKSPLTRYQVQSILKRALTSLGFTGAHFNTHSFRIGSATTAAGNSISEDQLKVMGRWNSAAYKAYIRIPSRRITSSNLV